MAPRENLKIMITQTEIADRVSELALGIKERLGPEPPLVIGLLTGSFMFVADLIRALHTVGVNPEVDFMIVASYRDKRDHSGSVEIIEEPKVDVAGREIVLVDDIVDTGKTLARTVDIVLSKGATKVWTCALLDKPSRRDVKIEADFTGFTIENRFVVGYGLDDGGLYRSAPYIAIINSSG